MLDALSDAQKHHVAHVTRMLEIRRGERVYMTGDPADDVFLLKTGAVRITVAGSDGRETLLAFLYPGDLFGERAIVDAAPRDHLATAHEEAVLCSMSRDVVIQLAQQIPTLGYQITKLMGLRLRRFRSRVEELRQRGLTQLEGRQIRIADEAGLRRIM